MCGCCCESCSECIDDRDGDCTTPVYQIILCCPCICAFMCLYPCCWKVRVPAARSSVIPCSCATPSLAGFSLKPKKKEPARREKTAIVPTNVYATQTTNWATGLRQAVIAGNIAEIQRLLALGADLEDRDMANGQRVLHNAAYLSTNGVLKSLLAAGANYQAVDNMSRTPLHHAAMSGSVACIDALIQAGANHEARDKYGHTPLDLARTYRRAEAIEFLASARPLQAYIKPAITRRSFLSMLLLEIFQVFGGVAVFFWRFHRTAFRRRRAVPESSTGSFDRPGDRARLGCSSPVNRPRLSNPPRLSAARLTA
eukprot:m.683191 g.683191  ORF g.683191 m.683191 type:complete len:312 (-) comp58604_c0_seq18:678-1613(-)